MKVYGCEISEETQEEVQREVSSRGRVTFDIVVRAIIVEDENIPPHVAYRGADRLLSKWKRESKIYFDRNSRLWVWKGESRSA